MMTMPMRNGRRIVINGLISLLLFGGVWRSGGEGTKLTRREEWWPPVGGYTYLLTYLARYFFCMVDVGSWFAGACVFFVLRWIRGGYKGTALSLLLFVSIQWCSGAVRMLVMLNVCLVLMVELINCTMDS